MLAHIQFSLLNLQSAVKPEAVFWQFFASLTFGSCCWSLGFSSVKGVKILWLTEWLKGISADHLVQLPCLSWATWSRLPRIVLRWLLDIYKDGDSSKSSGNQCQCSVNITANPESTSSPFNLSRNLWRSISRQGKATLKQVFGKILIQCFPLEDE